METSPPAAPPSSPGLPSPRATPRQAAATILALLLLVDAVVETWWSGSPLRWWLGPPIVAFVVGTAWLCRPGSTLLRRFGWRGASGMATGGLLALLAVAPWLPGGASGGIRMAGLPASVVLAAFAGLAVAFAVLGLARAAKSLPAVPRAVGLTLIGGIALYALVGLALAIRDQTPFSALLHGASAWQRLPSWLQGVWLGTRVLVPAALAMLGLEALRRRERGHARIAPALILAAAIGASLAPPADGPGAWPASALPVPIPGLVPGSGTPSAPAGPAPAIPVVPGEMAPILRAYKALPAEVDRTAFDVKARATALGPDSQAAFAFVRDRIITEPYPGVLRGAAGTLSAGGGNDVDKALLLAALLAEGKHQTRYAHCVLGTDEARALVKGHFTQSAMAAAPDVDLTPALARALERQGLSKKRSAEIAAARARTRDWLDAAVFETAGSDFTLLRETLARAGIRQAFADSTSTLVEEARQHYWLQLEAAGTWQDLDPSIPGAVAGRSLCQATETFDAPPAGLYQTITVSVRNEYAKDGTLVPMTVLTERVVVSDHYGDVLLFRNEPSGSSGPFDGQPKGLRPVLSAGAAATRGDTYELVTSGAGGFDPLGSSLSGDEPSKLVAQWLDFTFEAPGRKASVSRAVVDAVPPSERAQGRVTTSPNPDILLLSLLPPYAIAITAGAVSPGAAMESTFSALDVDAAARVFDARDDHEKKSNKDAPAIAAHALSAYALEFGVSSERELLRMASAAGPHLRVVRDQPMITIAAFSIDRSKAGAVSVRASIDLRHDVVRVVPDGPAYAEQAFWTNVQHGLVDGALEHRLPMIGTTAESQSSSPPFDTSATLAAARAAGIEVRGTAGAAARQLLQGDLAVAGGDRLAVEVQDGIAVVAPVRPPPIAGDPRLGLWTIDLSTGHVDALLGNGLRAVMVEFNLQVQALAVMQIAIAACLRTGGANCTALIAEWEAMAEVVMLRIIYGT